MPNKMLEVQFKRLDVKLKKNLGGRGPPGLWSWVQPGVPILLLRGIFHPGREALQGWGSRSRASKPLFQPVTVLLGQTAGV